MRPAIVILEPDPAARECWPSALKSAEFSDIAVAETAPEGAIVIWCGDKDTKPPENLNVRENDCFYKPVRIGAVLDRIRMYANTEKTRLVRIGPFDLDILADELAGRGTRIRLTDKERDLLLLLAKAKGKTVSRLDILHKIWGYSAALETHTLETHIYRLRQKIEENPANPDILLTDENGYRIKQS